jgi:hypothetical protein
MFNNEDKEKNSFKDIDIEKFINKSNQISNRKETLDLKLLERSLLKTIESKIENIITKSDDIILQNIKSILFKIDENRLTNLKYIEN